METTPITDQLRTHLAEHPDDVDAILDALAQIEALARRPEAELHAAVPEWP